ncbi:MAG: zinc ribbon domain-containing protein [Deltaproteobacteria bacterium]|nr:zinc ribbon domain-containing protein [Deltaproteobacteria bacterium]
MPVYEYESIDPKKICKKCANRLEIIQKIDKKPLSRCPYCGQKVKKSYPGAERQSWKSLMNKLLLKKINEYENDRMWSHAAGMTDKHLEKTKDRAMKIRALENYNKAGYDT